MGAFPKNIRMEIFVRDGAKCVNCGKKWDEGYMLECDHILAAQLGGSNITLNGRLLCRLCHLKSHEDRFKVAKTAKERNCHAYAVRILKAMINTKGVMRYGWEERKT